MALSIILAFIIILIIFFLSLYAYILFGKIKKGISDENEFLKMIIDWIVFGETKFDYSKLYLSDKERKIKSFEKIINKKTTFASTKTNMFEMINKEFFKVNKRKHTAKVIIEILPFIGLLGTILGITLSFSTISENTDIIAQISNDLYLALTSTFAALLAVIILKTTSESSTMALYDEYMKNYDLINDYFDNQISFELLLKKDSNENRN